ncbi:MAG: protein-disulfide reductase DsbD [Proteobacteria bacterium]|nr:protein-disulfide reductase DsbD [Pseudomonadota bacterium]
MIYSLNNRLRHALSLLALLALGTMSLATHAQDDELLPSDEAYAFSVEVTAEGLEAKWTIADGYYMYRDKLSFSLADATGTPIEINYDFPPSKTKADPAFGDVEVYVKHVDFSIPVSSDTQEVMLTVKGQGCNEPIGVCYPPITHKIPLKLIAASTAAAVSTSVVTPQMDATPKADDELASITELRDLLGAETADDELLPPDQAFKVSAITDRDGINVRFDIADGYYLYQNKLKFESATHVLNKPALPEGKLKQDEYFGEVIVYRNQFDALLKLAKASADETLILDAQYQGCADLGVCYPPQNKRFELSISDLISTASAQSAPPAPVTPPAAATPVKQAAIAASPDTKPETADAGTDSQTSNSTLWWVLLSAFAAGIGLTFTPCVLPLIPILSSVIAGQGESVTKSKAAWLAAVYVLGTAVTYAAIGAVAGATGDQLQAYFQNAWAIGIMAAIFFVMSLSMFGLYDIQMPSFIQSRMAQTSQGIKGGSIPMVFVLGLLSALIVGACVSPVLISFLSIAIAKGSPALGALIMFAMAMGMGIPLILLGMGAGHLLPKAGMWMDKVKYVFGVMLVGVAIYLLGVLPAVPVLYLWATLFIVVAIYLGATQSLPEGASGWQKLFKGFGTLLLIWGIMALFGAMYGERRIEHPLPEHLFSAAPANQATNAADAGHLFTRVNTLAELDQQLTAASRAGKKVMIDYYADWCVECLKMEETTFKDPAVRAELRANFAALQVDVTDPNDEKRKALKKRYGVFGPPAALFFDARGKQLKDKSFYGFKQADKFLQHLLSI